ncbi:MAG: DegT/DnrJ/EryC1/StrS family aminotransferase [Actinobacteria bacterium]|nr:DegT/DnrJ/EryC1/StrS family aminotransferase [Actinomycetota bacterium]
MIPFVDLQRQHESIRGELEAALLGAVECGDYILGADVAAFEQEFADFCGVRRCVGVASGTAALHLGLEALGVGERDEVIAPANTFIASILPIVKLGARPVLVDCEPDTASIDADQVAEALTPRTKAVIGVHLYGQPVARLEELRGLCDDAGIALVEDACQAHGARHGDRRVGSFGRFAAFSFYPSKNLGALGDAGAVTTDDDELAERVALLRTLGEKAKGTHTLAGWNERLDTVQAAVLRVKLRHLDDWNRRRRKAAARYADALAGSGVRIPIEAPCTEHVWHLYVVRHERRDELRAALREDGVATGIHYPTPLHLHEPFAYLGYERGSFPRAEAWAAEQLSLPMFAELRPDEIDRVAAVVTRAVARVGEPVQAR